MVRGLMALAFSLSSAAPTARDTSQTQSAIRELMAALADRVAVNGLVALREVSAGLISIQLPEFATMIRADPRAEQMLASLPAGTVKLVFQHAIVSNDDALGCAVGTVLRVVPTAKSGGHRFGRFVACWARHMSAREWQLRAFALNGTSDDGGPPDVSLAGPQSAIAVAPHSATLAATETDARFAKLSVDSGPSIAFRRYAAADGMLLGARARPRQGPDEIGAAFAPAASDQEFSWTPNGALSTESGGLAVTVGDATIKRGLTVTRTKYLTVWREDTDGHWRFVLDLGSPRP
jgi:hypothetical protein